MSADLRSRLTEACRAELNEKLTFLQSEYKLYTEAANSETKSTAGDKHDTSRSMMQLEQEKMGAQLKAFREQIRILDTIHTRKSFEQPGLGNIFITDNGNFFISVFGSQIRIEDQTYIPVSAKSPIAVHLIRIKPGSSFEFNSRAYTLIKML